MRKKNLMSLASDLSLTAVLQAMASRPVERMSAKLSHDVFQIEPLDHFGTHFRPGRVSLGPLGS